MKTQGKYVNQARYFVDLKPEPDPKSPARLTTLMYLAFFFNANLRIVVQIFFNINYSCKSEVL